MVVTTQVPEPLSHLRWLTRKGKKESNRVFCVGNTQFVLAGNAGFSECLANMVLASVTISWCY